MSTRWGRSGRCWAQAKLRSDAWLQFHELRTCEGCLLANAFFTAGRDLGIRWKETTQLHPLQISFQKKIHKKKCAPYKIINFYLFIIILSII